MNGILFKPESIQAIIEGRKTQTRRVIKPQPLKEKNLWQWGMSKHKDTPLPLCIGADERQLAECIMRHPRFQVGETVYVKEAHYRYGKWIKNGFTKTGKQKWMFSPPDKVGFQGELRYYDNPPDEVKPNSYRKEAWYKRSPLFMPEWAARCFLTITDVRAERLQEITVEDMIAEGMIPQPFDTCKLCPLGICSKHQPVMGQFHNLWDSINKENKWESNPWDFAYTFKQDKEKMR